MEQECFIQSLATFLVPLYAMRALKKYPHVHD